MLRLSSSMARRAKSSVAGPAPFEMYDSVACTSASVPLKAVTRGGMERVMSGSVRATVGQIFLLMTRNLVWRSASISTTPSEISLPVPEVVGTVTTLIDGTPGTLSKPA